MKRKMSGLFIGLIFAIAGLGISISITTAQGEATNAYMPLMMRAPGATATPTPIPPSDWFNYLNTLRALGSLPAVTENAAWSSGCWYHARYMVKNDTIEHSEDSANPWFTEEGLAAAQNGNLMVSSSTAASDAYAIDLWMSGPFHGVGLLDPALLQSGFGSYREADGGWEMGACLDVLRGLGAIPPSVTFPVRWPENGATLPYFWYGGTEYPDPLSSCPGYTAPSGPPIYLLIGSGNQTPAVTGHSFTQGSTPLEHCVFDETSYTHPDGSMQNLGRAVLDSRDAIILMPRQPLSPGVSYNVSITTNGQTYTWSLTTPADRQQTDFSYKIPFSLGSALTGFPPQP